MEMKGGAAMEVKVERSARRLKSVAARVKDGVMIVSAPVGMSDAELAPIITRLQARLARRSERATLDDAALMRRALALSAEYFAGKLHPTSVRWVTNQNLSRWASCTQATGAIRISHRLAQVPAFVLDGVLVHELVHLAINGHGPDFWTMANRYPLTERTRGYLLALAGQDDDDNADDEM